MKRALVVCLRLAVGILAGILTGLFIVFGYAVLLLIGQSIYYSMSAPPLRVAVWSGGLKSAAAWLPVVTFALPLMDAWICPGIVTGALAHRFRSYRALAAVGALSGLAFVMAVRATYGLFDPILTAGFVVLEIGTAAAVSRMDAWLMRMVGDGANHVEPASIGMMKKKWIAWALLFAASALFVGIEACCMFARRDAAFEKAIQDFVDEGRPGSEAALFNGENLGGWEAHGFGAWSIEDGVLTVRRGMGYLSTRCNEFTDLILDVDVKVNRQGNSGIFFRAKHPGWGLRSQPVGYEAQVDHHDPKNPTGSLYNRATAHPVVSRDGEWFHMMISAIGEKIEIQVNGTIVVDAASGDYEKGFIALQAHDPFSVVSFKNLRVRIPEDE
ncbi:MAG: DUF1080 domain-containing protein [Candidatus Omnitrophica bacterium]|nr:DUF1080 domain-containing protein [Candidatus Omnitrophota bacterium]